MVNEKKHFLDLPDNINRDKKRCESCHKIKPLTSDFWRKDSNRISGYQGRCKICMSKTQKKSYSKNKQSIAERNKTPQYVYIHMKSQAKKRNINFDLEISDFENSINMKCFYCGGDSIGWFDRKYNDKDIGYIKNNIVPCCAICNRMKGILDLDEFYFYINNISNNLKKHRVRLKDGKDYYNIKPWNDIRNKK